MFGSSRLQRAAQGVVLGVLQATACVDTSPVDFKAPEKDAAGAGDDATPEAAITSPCRECMTDADGPCRTVYATCLGLTTCPPVLDCLLDEGCLLPPALQDRLSCGLPCLEKNGVMAGSDPTTQALGQLNVCSLAPAPDGCLEACKEP